MGASVHVDLDANELLADGMNGIVCLESVYL